MKRTIAILITILSVYICATAQTGLQINKVFGGKYVGDSTVTETVMNGDHRFLRKNKLTALAIFRGNSETFVPILQPLVLADGKDAVGRNVRYHNGKLQFAFFKLRPTQADGRTVERYLYYLYNHKSKRPYVMLIYLEGNINNQSAENLIISLRKSKK